MITDLDLLRTELAEAQRQIAELSQKLETQRQLQAELRESEQRFRELTEASNETIVFTEQGLILDANPRVKPMFGYAIDEVVGRSALDFIAPEHHATMAQNIRTNYALPYESVGVRKDGTRFPIELTGRSFPYRGRVARVTVVLDLTERRRAEEAAREAALKEEALRTRDEILARMATPLLPITDTIVVAPLVGEMTLERGRQAAETLVVGVAHARAKVAIIDITGVPSVDTQFADQLLSAARAIRLLGVEVVLTGISPELAQTAVQAGLDLKGMATMSTLQRGVAYAMRRG